MMSETIQEVWAEIPGFSSYRISNLGRVFNMNTDRVMRTSTTGFGHVKISLMTDSGYRETRSVAQMVAQAFVEPPNPLCDNLILLDGNLENVAAYNLAWRTRGFAWEYTHQLKVSQPLHYQNLMVRNIDTNEIYNSIIEAGMREGLLFKDIWRSTWTEARILPYGHTFEVIQRV